MKSGYMNAIPQPWELEGLSRDAFMASAKQQEAQGRTLGIETWVNGYADPNGDGTEWIVDWLHYDAYETGEPLGGYDAMDDEPGIELSNIYVVERRLRND